MVDIVFYRAAIGSFYYVNVPSRLSRQQHRQSKHAARRRRYFNPGPFLFIVCLFAILTVKTYSSLTFQASSVCNLNVTCYRSVSFPSSFAEPHWQLLKFVHYMNTNHGAHAYNGNPRTPVIKKRLDPLQQTLKGLMKKSYRINDSEPDFSDDSQDCFLSTPCMSPPSSTFISSPLRSDFTPDEACFSANAFDQPSIIITNKDDEQKSLPNDEQHTPSTLSDSSENSNTSSTLKYDRFKQGFLKSWFDKVPSMKEWCKSSDKGPNYAFCFICNKDLKVEGGGLKDLLKHPKSVKHTKAANEQKSTKPLKKHFEPSAISEQVANAEILWSTFIAEHQLSFRIADHASKLFAKMFPDSNIAKEFKCCRTKSRNIICKVLAPKLEETISQQLKNSFFSVLTDETTDISIKSQCCILVRFFDNFTGTVKGAFFKIVHLKSTTGEAVFNGKLEAFKKSNIPLKNVIALGTDGAATMIGKTKGLFGCLRQVQQNVFSVWCICHQIHIAAKKASNVFPKEIQDLPVELFYWFKKSHKRCSAFKDMQLFCNVIDHKLLKPSDTRWLATQEIAERLSEQWLPLKSYFNSLPTDFEVDHSGQRRKVDKITRDKILKIRKILNSELNQLCFLFLKDILKKFTTFNQFFQTSKPVAYLMNKKMCMLLKDILSCFMLPSVIKQNSENLCDIDEKCEANYCDKEDMFIGDVSTFSLLTQLEDNGKHVLVDQFHDFVKQFYVHSVRELKKLPFKDEVITNLRALDPMLQGTIPVRKMFMCLAKVFSNVIEKDDLVKLDIELRNYDTYDLPGLFKDDFEYCDGNRINFINDVDSYWFKLGKLAENGNLTFPTLSKLAKALLCIPHGNAESEQLFSRLKLTKTKFKSNMKTVTLSSLLTVNFNMDCNCFEFKATKDIITKVRIGLNNKEAESKPVAIVPERSSPSKPRVKRARKNNSIYNDFVPE